jgi:HPt (histidine-containing phosphotransfer) domain-containing protein
MSEGEGERIVLDLDGAAAKFSGSLLRELAGLLLSGSQKHIANIRAALREKDPRKLQIAAHTLKGDAFHFQAEQVIDLARRIEDLAKDGDLARAESLYADLTKAVSRVQETLRSFLKEQKDLRGTN